MSITFKHWSRVLSGLLTAVLLLPVPVFAAVSFGGWKVVSGNAADFSFMSTGIGSQNNELIFDLTSPGQSIQVTSTGSGPTFGTLPFVELENPTKFPNNTFSFVTVTIAQGTNKGSTGVLNSLFPGKFLIPNQFSLSNNIPVTVTLTFTGTPPKNVSPYVLTFNSL
jgi:hypothetical protein